RAGGDAAWVTAVAGPDDKSRHDRAMNITTQNIPAEVARGQLERLSRHAGVEGAVSAIETGRGQKMQVAADEIRVGGVDRRVNQPDLHAAAVDAVGKGILPIRICQ